MLKGRYEQAALAIPALLLGGVSLAAWYVAVPTIGLLNDFRKKPQSEGSAWEHRFGMAVEGHLTSSWGHTTAAVQQEHTFIDWVKGELALKPDRIRYSEKIWWHMRKWSHELSMREKILPR